MEPESRCSPLALSCRRGDIDHVCRLFDGKTAKESQLNDLRLAWVEFGELAHGVVESNEIKHHTGLGRYFFVEGDGDGSAPAFCRGPTAGMIHQDLPHHLGGHGKKMGSILPGHGVVARQAQICLVHESSRLECVIGLLSRQTAAGDAAKFIVNERDQSFSGRGISTTPAGQQVGYRVGRQSPHEQSQLGGSSPKVARRYPGSGGKSMSLKY